MGKPRKRAIGSAQPERPAGIIVFPASATALPRTPRTVALAKLLAQITRDYVREAA